MIIESVKLLKTLKAGPNIWMEGTVFPNRNCPSIPKDILGEAVLGKPTVEILVQSPGDEDNIPHTLENTEGDTSESMGETNITMNVESYTRNKDTDLPVAKSGKTPRSKPKGKPSLAKRK